MKYFLRNNEKELPPFSFEELKEFNKKNDLSNYSYWHQGMTYWEKFNGSKLQDRIKVKKNLNLWVILIVISLFVLAIIVKQLQNNFSEKEHLTLEDSSSITEFQKNPTIEMVEEKKHSEIEKQTPKMDNQVSIDPRKSEVSSNKILIEKNVKSLDQLFEEWEQILKYESAFDYVTNIECEEQDRMYDLYTQGLYPMTTSSKTIIDFNFNNDGIKDYLVNYSLLNCVQGNGYSSDFIFITSSNGQLKINSQLTNKLKQHYFNYVKNNFGQDVYVYKKRGYIATKSFQIKSIDKNGLCSGDFYLSQNGATCCPQFQGSFTYDIQTDKFEVYNLKNNE